MRSRSRVVAILVGCLTLAGCALTPNPSAPSATIPHDAPSGGQTLAELTATLQAIDGLELEDFSCSEPNAKGNTGCSYRLRLSPGFQLLDRVGFVDFLVASAWSVRDTYQPNTSIMLHLVGDPQDPFSLDDVVVEAGWAPPSEPGPPMAENGFTSATIWLSTDEMLDAGGPANVARLGTWPGDAPAAPTDMIVPVVP